MSFGYKSFKPCHETILDAFARVIIGSKAADTRVIWETRSPTWDQMVIFNDVVIWGDVITIANNPPTIVTEIFDKDIGVGYSIMIGISKAATGGVLQKMCFRNFEKCTGKHLCQKLFLIKL